MEGLTTGGKIVFNSITQNITVGWISTVLFWVMEHFNSIAGMALTGCVTVFTILKARAEYLAVKNEEKRREERHRQEMRQDEENHDRTINS